MADSPFPTVAQGSLFGEADALGYTTPVVYDEMVDGQGRLRAHWQTLMGALGGLDRGRMAERWEEARRLLHQNGVTFNIYGDPQGMERPWPLDMLPLVIPPEEWQTIAAGLAQRARLLNALLADVYGPQALVRDGALPPALVFADPGFRRAVHGVPVPGGTHLHLYAADLVRAADGRWWVMSDRTQAPSGSGYALENRTVLSRVLPDGFRVCRAERLAPFFAGFREALASLSPRGDPARIVLLTPGPYNETYFEHVYLARHLGLTLVEGADLTVRDRRVWLKTLSGLEPVDVILRRVDDDYADPLALRADSSLGVAGLAEAVRAGTVAVANALGSGLLESLSFRPFLDGLNRRLFGEDLILPHVATWWCGQEAECRHVLDHLGELVIAPAFRSLPFEPVHGCSLSQPERDDLAARIRRSPWAFVAHQPPGLSTAPVWESGQLQPRPLVLRVFLCATPDGGYTAMPGGLARVCAEPGRLIVSMQHGGGSKDTWVLSPDRPAGPMAHRAVPDARPLQASIGDLPSRVADGLFWLGRYAERAEGCVRLLRGACSRLTDGNQPGAPEELRVLLRLMAPLGVIPWEQAPMAGGGGLDGALRAAVFDESHPNSLRANVQRLHRAGYSVRDRLSLDLWRVISQLDRQSQWPSRPVDAASLLLRLDGLMTSLAALAGLEQESMMRGHGWRFLDMGRRMERAVHMVSLVRFTPLPAPEAPDATAEAALEVLLELGESFMAYRERTLAGVDRGPVLDLLLCSEENPRALAFQLAALERHVAALPRGSGEASAAALNLLAAARAALRGSAALHHPEALRTALDALGRTLPDLSNLLAHAYFSHAFARPA